MVNYSNRDGKVERSIWMRQQEIVGDKGSMRLMLAGDLNQAC